MKSIRLENFRNLVDTGSINLKPITLLVGANSSGKSSFLRFFPLLKQSQTARSAGPILWYSEDLVDFGGFRETVNSEDTSKVISLFFTFETSLKSQEGKIQISFTNAKNVFMGNQLDLIPFFKQAVCCLKLAFDEKQELDVIDSIELNIEDHKILLRFSSSNVVEEFLVNNRNILTELRDHGIKLGFKNVGGLIPGIDSVEELDDANIIPPRGMGMLKDTKESNPFASFLVRSKNRFFDTLNSRLSDILNAILDSEIKKHVRSNTRKETIKELRNKLRRLHADSNMMLRFYKDEKSIKTWTSKTSSWNSDSEDFKRIRDFVIASQVPSLLVGCSDYLRFFSQQIRYIGPVRATAERYYRRQNLNVGEVDAQGKNLAMFLKSLTDDERTSFSEWTQSNFHFSVNPRPDGDHIVLKIKQKGSQREVNLADTGFGFSQILPILTQIWYVIYSNSGSKDRLFTLAIEQPELHLHPKFQGFLVDTLVKCVKVAAENNIELKFILETHSPIFINRFGHQIVEGQLAQDDINVVLFEKDEQTGNTNVKTTSYDNDGFLKYWPIGFLEPNLID